MKPFLQLRTTEEAYACIDTFTAVGTETIDPRSAAGRVLAADVRAACDVPHFERSNMDGYAVVAADTFGACERRSVALRLAGQVAAGEEAVQRLEPGSAIGVSTGAMLPPGADAVVMVEYTDSGDDGTVSVRQAAAAGQHVVRIGEDMATGDLVLEAGRRLRGPDIGALTGTGTETIEVFKLPRVAVMGTGDEIVDPGEDPGPGRVRNINQYVLKSVAADCGAEVLDLGVIADDPDALASALRKAVAEADGVIIAGGSSMGRHDLTAAAVGSLDASELLFHGLAIAPGRPTLLARAAKVAVMGLPGNPAAAAVVLSLFASVLIRVLGGEKLRRILIARPTVRATLAAPVPSTEGREEYIRVRLADGGAGCLRASPILGRSMAISTMAGADGMLRIPASSEGIDGGTQVEVMLF